MHWCKDYTISLADQENNLITKGYNYSSDHFGNIPRVSHIKNKILYPIVTNRDANHPDKLFYKNNHIKLSKYSLQSNDLVLFQEAYIHHHLLKVLDIYNIDIPQKCTIGYIHHQLYQVLNEEFHYNISNFFIEFQKDKQFVSNIVYETLNYIIYKYPNNYMSLFTSFLFDKEIIGLKKIRHIKNEYNRYSVNQIYWLLENFFLCLDDIVSFLQEPKIDKLYKIPNIICMTASYACFLIELIIHKKWYSNIVHYSSLAHYKWITENTLNSFFKELYIYLSSTIPWLWSHLNIDIVTQSQFNKIHIIQQNWKEEQIVKYNKILNKLFNLYLCDKDFNDEKTKKEFNWLISTFSNKQISMWWYNTIYDQFALSKSNLSTYKSFYEMILKWNLIELEKNPSYINLSPIEKKEFQKYILSYIL